MKTRPRSPEAAAPALAAGLSTALHIPTRHPFEMAPLRHRRTSAAPWNSAILVLLAVLCLISSSRAAYVNFENCIPDPDVRGSPPPLPLQFVPYNVSVYFNLTDPNKTLNITIHGNVEGQAVTGPLPPPTNESYWNNPNETRGKITDLDPSTSKYSTLFATLDVLNYVAFENKGERFCGALISDTVVDNKTCPLAPVFGTITPQNSITLPAVSWAHPMMSSYGFTTISAQVSAVQGNAEVSQLLCVNLDITPYLGVVAENLLTYIPLLLLVLIAVATASAAIFSPWGTWDVFHATSNYGRDVRLLRMITPGFGDCLNYLQFIVLTSSLKLSYPGFFQPVASSVAWSVLMFNESFATHGSGRPGIVDGIYIANGTYGLDTMSQLVGMTSDQDIWAGMMVWLLTAVGCIVVLIQIAFALRWAYRKASRTQEEDLRAKNLPFSAGNTIRIVFNYFLMPLTTFSFFQLLIAGNAPTPALAAIAALTLLILLGFGAWVVWVILNARPRSFLFDDLPTVLLYGPLYNTYSDSAAHFAVVTIAIDFIRGIAFGALQSSGVAQIVLLAVCELGFLLTLNAFRPFFTGTSMNIINTLFSIGRLIIILMMIAFVPSMNISDASKGYIGYVILLLHALALFAGFFIRIASTLFELTARAAGAGDDTSAIGGFARVVGLRQLSRRDARDAARSRNSYASNATMLNHNSVEKARIPSAQRSRSASVMSGILLNNGAPARQSVALESVSGFGARSQTGSNVPASLNGGGAPSTISRSHNGAGPAAAASAAATLAGLRSLEPSDPYFRTPRARRVTMETPEGALRDGRSHASWDSGDWAKLPEQGGDTVELGEGPSISGRGTPLPLGATRDRTDSMDDRAPKPDYATREVDYYYGVRGPALSHAPTRRLRTGPNDPTGPVSSATGWFKSFFGNKTKEKGKGFEVVRSSRMPPQMEMEEKDPAATGTGKNTATEPYADEPESSKRRLELDDEGDAVGAGSRCLPGDTDAETPGALRGGHLPAQGDGILQLPEIDAGESIQLPSRWASRASAKPSRAQSTRTNDVKTEQPPPVPELVSAPLPALDLDWELEPVPGVPRRSSKRNSASGSAGGSRRGSAGMGAPAVQQQRIPFGNTDHMLSAPPETLRHARTLSGASDVSALSHASDLSEFGRPSAVSREERPSSLGYVQQHRASDGIRHVADSNGITRLGPEFSGSAAELVVDDQK